MDHEERHDLHEIAHWLKEISHTLRRLVPRTELNNSIKLTIPNQEGENMGQPQTLTVGLGTVQAQVVESLNGTPTLDANGNPVYNGPLAFASDTPAVCTIDPASGLVTPVSAGTANLSVLDAIGNLTDSNAVTVLAGAPPPPTPNNGIAMTIPAQSASGRRR